MAPSSDLMSWKGLEARAGNCGNSSEVSKIELPAPGPLEGVKSLNRPVFDVKSMDVATDNGTFVARHLAMTLSSRIVALGAEGRLVAEFLLDEARFPAAEHHKDLKVFRLAPWTFSSTETSLGYAHAINLALNEQRPQILVLDEAESSHDAAWHKVFNQLVHGEQLKMFRGAVVVCTAEKSDVLQAQFTEEWIAEGDEIRQRPCLRMIDAMTLDIEMLREDVVQFVNVDLKYWIDRAQKENWMVTRFDVGGCEGRDKTTLRGLIFHNMFEQTAEFHVRFVYVPEKYRQMGIGAYVMRWAIDQASHMPQSECKWISLSAADDDLVPWYEKFGFFDMSCGHQDGDYGQVWMEMPNLPRS